MTQQAHDACIDAEALSCFIDGELSADRTAAAKMHVSQCRECAEVLTEMQSLSGRRRAHSDISCPDSESLAGYLLGRLAAAERDAVDSHVLTCDACVQALVTIHRQLQRPWTLDAPVPRAIIERAFALTRPGADRSLSLIRRRTQPPDRVPAYLRLPVLMPVAFAAGAAFFIAVKAANLAPGARVSHSRGVSAFTGNRRVTTAEALVRSEPRDTAAVVARLARGVAVEVQAEEREWLLVALPTQEHGWVPRRAFE
ncbi:MAG TPA: zf-HC2 domain-containing protein [Candidatus Acidoferrales bacterium]|nr:zf-HC2 domain-containing protein [Candidatus Acidoferrales bacterium]